MAKKPHDAAPPDTDAAFTGDDELTPEQRAAQSREREFRIGIGAAAVEKALASRDISHGHLLCRARLREVVQYPGTDHDDGSRTMKVSAEFLERLRYAIEQP